MSKLFLSNKIGFTGWPRLKHPIKFNSGKKNVVIFQTWDSLGYMPYMYYSILSQLLYTDLIQQCDLYIFVDEPHHELYTIGFRDLIPPENIILSPKRHSYKYMSIIHPIFQKYENIVVIDADMFFYSKNNRISFFSEVFNYLEQNPKTGLMFDGVQNSRKTFNQRIPILCSSLSQEKYKDFIIKSTPHTKQTLDKWLDSTTWFFSCVFAFKRSTFITTEYIKYATEFSFYDQLCDESVWLSWASSNNIKIKAIDKELNCNVYMKYRKHHRDIYSKNRLNLIHPIVGSEVLNTEILGLLKEIEEDFKEKFGYHIDD